MVLVVVLGDKGRGILSWDNLESIFTTVFGDFSEIVICSRGENGSDLEPHLALCDAVVLVENEAPEEVMETSSCNELNKALANKCVEKRQRVVHLVKNYRASQSGRPPNSCKRTNKIFWRYDLQVAAVNAFIEQMNANKSDRSFSSPGESFAWQLVVGFLRYVLPSLKDHIQSALLDDAGFIRQDVLNSYGLDDLDPRAVLVVPRFHLVLDERIVSSQHPSSQVTSSSPQRLFDGCSTICNGSEELNLEFDSPGYKKRIPVYLMELYAPLSRGDSTFTHAVIFGGYAAPLFVMQKLPMADDEKAEMFEQFRDELMLIQKHPKANAVLRDLSDSSTGGVVESEPSALCVINATDEGSLRSSILADIEDFLLNDGQSVVPRSNEQPSGESAEDDLPLMSVAFALAANTWFGFAKFLDDEIQQLSADGKPIPFDLPYLFVIPKSGRYPDWLKLLIQFDEIGVRWCLQEFGVSGGRRYSYRVIEWRSRRIAFEIPTSVLGILKQSEHSVGGIAPGDLRAHLTEFRDALQKFVADSGDRFKVVEWDDVAGFDDTSWAEPSRDFVLSLLNNLFT